jgi:hypothetical protein
MKRVLITTLVVAVSILVTGGIVYAATTHNITSVLGGKSGEAFDLDGTIVVDSLKVGAQGVGGVTFFNGTIINDTKTSTGGDNPVAFGDNVRIDGRVYRGALAGVTDTQPFLVNDNMEVAGSLTAASLSTGALTATSLVGAGIVSSDNLASNSVTSAKIADGTIATADIAGGAVTQGVEGTLTSAENTVKTGADFDTLTSLSITTGASSLFCSWSGYGDTPNNPTGMIRVEMLLDGVRVDRTIRITRTSGVSTGVANMATQAILPIAAGTHTVALNWNTDSMANMYYNTLDCIELKK